MKLFAIAAFGLVLASGSVNAEMPKGYDERIANLPHDITELPAGETLIIPIIDNTGGDINTFITNRIIMEHYGVAVEISGKCYSSCVIYSGMKDACVEESAWFLFHQGTNEWTTLEMLRQINPHFKTYLANYGVPLPPIEYSKRDEMDGQDYIALSGKVVIENGWMAKCPEF